MCEERNYEITIATRDGRWSDTIIVNVLIDLEMDAEEWDLWDEDDQNDYLSEVAEQMTCNVLKTYWEPLK